MKSRPGLGRIEGQLLIAEVAGEVLGLAERGGVGVGCVLTGTPVGGPERAEQSLDEDATRETQSQPQQSPDQATTSLRVKLNLTLSPAPSLR